MITEKNKQSNSQNNLMNRKEFSQSSNIPQNDNKNLQNSNLVTPSDDPYANLEPYDSKLTQGNNRTFTIYEKENEEGSIQASKKNSVDMELLGSSNENAFLSMNMNDSNFKTALQTQISTDTG